MRVIVVGAGIVGSCIALRLAQSGARVLVLDRSQPGYGATGSSFAWANARNKMPLSYLKLSVEGIRAFERLAAELAGREWWHPTGSLQVRELQAEPGDAIARMRAEGQRVEELDRRGALELEPDLLLGAQDDEFLFYPDEGFIFPLLAVGSILAAARSAGAEVRPDTEVTGLATDGGRVTGVQVGSEGEIGADLVVVAAGIGSERVLTRPLGLSLPMIGVDDVAASVGPTNKGPVGLLAVTEKVPAAVRRVVHLQGLHFRPDGAGRVMLQNAEVEQTVTASTPTIPLPVESHELLARGRRAIRYLDGAEIESVHVGIRPLPIDGYPIVGGMPGVEGLYVVVTHSGLTLGAVLGEIAVEELLRGRESRLLMEYRPSRFALKV